MRNDLRFARSQRGATTIEYAIIAIFLSVAALLAFILVGNNVNESFTDTSTKFNNATSQ